jgi:tellurite resistance protein TehA-like permease
MQKVSLAAQIGFVSAIMAITAITVYMVCFFAILVVNPLTVWSTFDAYLAQQRAYNRSFIYLAQATMLLFPLVYLLMVNCVHDRTPITQSVLTRAATMFAFGFALLGEWSIDK